VQNRPWLPWNGWFAIEAVAACTMYLSLRHGKGSKTVNSPLQQITGKTPYFARDFPAAFGDLIMVENPTGTDGAIYYYLFCKYWLIKCFETHRSLVVGCVVEINRCFGHFFLVGIKYKRLPFYPLLVFTVCTMCYLFLLPTAPCHTTTTLLINQNTHTDIPFSTATRAGK
jgi:hypothetical protein